MLFVLLLNIHFLSLHPVSGTNARRNVFISSALIFHIRLVQIFNSDVVKPASFLNKQQFDTRDSLLLLANIFFNICASGFISGIVVTADTSDIFFDAMQVRVRFSIPNYDSVSFEGRQTILLFELLSEQSAVGDKPSTSLV